jgi:Fe-coproporphyrin III synthase
MSPLSGSESLPARGHALTQLPVLVLNLHSRCNCRCVMCDIWQRNDGRELNRELLEKHGTAIRTLGVEWVVLSGGEPLLHSDLASVADLFHKHGIRLTLLTTGLLIAKKSAMISRVFDEVIVSLDGPRHVHDRIRRVRGAFDLIVDGIRALRAQDFTRPIRARMTVQKENFGHLRETIDAALAANFSSISLLAADVSSTAFNRELLWPVSRQNDIGLDLAELCVLRSEMEAVIQARDAEIPPGFISEDEAKLRRIVRHFEAQLGLREPVAPRCNAPWVSAVVEADGRVRPCFFHPSFGNIHEHDLATVLNSKEALQFRESLEIGSNPICQRCVCSLHRS